MISHGETHLPRHDGGISLDFKRCFGTIKEIHQMFLAQILNGLGSGRSNGQTRVEYTSGPPTVPYSALTPNNLIKATSIINGKSGDQFL